jgi:glycosyltransferase involved in cell wall biosynthesis
MNGESERKRIRTAILHYTAPPIVGGVEMVIHAHVRELVEAGYPVTVIAGRPKDSTLPGVEDYFHIPLMDTRHERVIEMNSALERGKVPPGFEEMVDELVKELAPKVSQFDTLIIHNVLTKRFNLPLTAALHKLLDGGKIHNCIAWCHDHIGTSRSSRSRVHPGYPWDLLRTYRPDVTYVAVSERRRASLAGVLECPLEEVRVVYNGVSPNRLLGLSTTGQSLVNRLGLLESDLTLLMPVRVTRAKNIEYALHVVADLKSRGCRVKLVLTGPPDPHDTDSMAYFRSLQELRSQLDVGDEMRFVFESGPEPGQPYTIDDRVVGDLYRVSDLMFVPSHREGFGMPVLEAGLVGLPVVSSANVPAADEIGGEDVIIFGKSLDPGRLAEQILAWAEENPAHRLRRRVRQNFTWKAIFQRDIQPLLKARERHYEMHS